LAESSVVEVWHQCKLHIVILDHDWLKDNRECSKPMISHKMMTKILCGNFEKSFLEWEKMASRKIFRHFLHVNVFVLISYHTVFLVQFGINLHLWVFQKAEITLAEAARAISKFWKTHSCKFVPNWTRNRMITYTNVEFLFLKIVVMIPHSL